MLYSVKGELIHLEPRVAVISCGGVGFRCQITMNTARQLPAVGSEAMLYTMMNVREDAIELFGFADQNELACFKQLTAISGVGPKVGVSILSELSPERVALAVATGDYKALTKAAGVGPKLAQRKTAAEMSKMGKGTLNLFPGGYQVVQQRVEYNVPFRVVDCYESDRAYIFVMGNDHMMVFNKKYFGETNLLVREVLIANMGAGRRFFKVDQKGKVIENDLLKNPNA
jgi:Holliday junction DNA helicase RuvA